MLNHIPSRPSSPVKQHPQSHSKKLQVSTAAKTQAGIYIQTHTHIQKSIVQSHIDLYRPKCLSESVSRQRPSIDKHVTPTIPKQKPLASDRSKQSPFVPYSEKIAPNGKYAQMLKDAAKPAKKPKHPTNPIDDAFLTNWGKSFWDPNLNLSMSEFSLVGPVSFVGGASESAKYTTLEYNGSVSEVHVSQITASAAEPPSAPPTTLLYNNDTRESFESSLDFSVPTISKSPIKTSSPHPSPAQISVKASANNVLKGEATIETNETAPLDKVVNWILLLHLSNLKESLRQLAFHKSPTH
ncbi:hypothetical protein BCR33DRAFT_779765 [Rhizoclosmatium globosum]|uniref:Uncharacterized protein n=1 Tax=Rhizoclosmatium globosum TaxID=329046 RepID=A0A1Y2CZP6_9FUNG|nr:hypothetical protein BCR33DRAFT_779765 [Rhizoclosmatium globosum]|eukprot:ORY52470.1 hypothetical protein BCR33DRAFT_779765 [Rhizoclosmatium globosum]